MDKNSSFIACNEATNLNKIDRNVAPISKNNHKKKMVLQVKVSTVLQYHGVKLAIKLYSRSQTVNVRGRGNVTPQRPSQVSNRFLCAFCEKYQIT